jgi:glutamate:Na+ symporter, ESS family
MEEWGIIVYFLLIGVLMFVAKVLKTWVPGLNKVVIPTALLGGFIGLVISLVFAPIITGQETFYDVNALIFMVYHALAIGFIALALKRDSSKIKKKIWSTGMLITSTYAMQALIGLLVVLLFFSTKFAGSGMLVALGFGQGPGLAISIGSVFDNVITDGTFNTFAVLGASYSFLGFVFGGTIGVLLINIISRKRGVAKPKHYQESSTGKITVEIDTIKEISTLDGLTTQGIIIAIIYGLVFLTLHVLDILIGDIAGGAVFGLIKGFNFIIGILYALLYKSILMRFERKGKNIRFMTNNYMLSNIASASFNIMIAGSVLTITLDFLAAYGVQLVVTAILVGIITMFYLRFMTKRIYADHHEEYFIGLFGMLTGVASTGLALLKGIDPNLDTPVAEEMVLGSGTAISMALPLFAILFIPILTYGSPNELLWNWIAVLGCLTYTVVFAIILMIRTRRGVNV